MEKEINGKEPENKSIEQIAWELAKKSFKEKCGFEPNLEKDQHLLVVSSIQEGILIGINREKENNYSKENMIKASEYGYNFHKTTQFPNQKFEDSCINNTKQWLNVYKK